MPEAARKGSEAAAGWAAAGAGIGAAALSELAAARYGLQIPAVFGALISQGVQGILAAALGALGVVSVNRAIASRQRPSIALDALGAAVTVAGGVISDIAQARNKAHGFIDELNHCRERLTGSLGGGANVPMRLEETCTMNRTAVKRLEEAHDALGDAAEALRRFVRRYA